MCARTLSSVEADSISPYRGHIVVQFLCISIRIGHSVSAPWSGVQPILSRYSPPIPNIPYKVWEYLTQEGCRETSEALVQPDKKGAQVNKGLLGFDQKSKTREEREIGPACHTTLRRE